MKNFKTFLAAILVMCACASAWALEPRELSMCRMDSTYYYDEEGQPVFKKIFAFDSLGNEILYSNYDYINQRWIGNYMKQSYYEDKKMTVVDFYWELNNWAPAEMKVTEFNDAHLTTANVFFEWENEEWQSNRKVEYIYDEEGKVSSLVLSHWRNDQWVPSKPVAATIEDVNLYIE